MLRTACAALVLFSSAAIVVCVRTSDDAASMGPGGDEVTNLINILEKAVLTTAKTTRKSDFIADVQEKIGEATGKNTQGGGKTGYLDKGGWTYLCQTSATGFKLSRGECLKLWNLPSMKVNHNSEDFVTIDTVLAAVLGGGTQEERDGVLAAVWQKLTPNSETTLTPGMLTCKKDGPSLNQPQQWRQGFLDLMASKAGVAQGTPVTFEVFKAYYHTLCQKCSHRHFVLMVVNAWHLMGGPQTPSPTSPTGYEGVWSRVNTVNLRVRVFSNDDPDGGQIVTLWDDCGVFQGDYSDGVIKSKLTIIADRLRLQMQDGTTENISFDGIDINGAV